MATSPTKLLTKRERSSSTTQLLKTEQPQLLQPHQKSRKSDHLHVASPLLPHAPGEPKSSYFARLADKIENGIFSAAHAFSKDGIYVYKRPVRSASAQHAALLAQAGSVFHHVVIYLKHGAEFVSFEFCPGNNMDVTENMLEEAPPAPILNKTPEMPEKQHLPMLHISADHHAWDAAHILQAIKFAESRAYNVIKNNCIAFADFVVRILTHGRIRNAPLIFDHMVGTVPATDSPMLPMVQLLTEMSWFNITDGGRLMLEYIKTHGEDVLVPLSREADMPNTPCPAAHEMPADSTWSSDTAAEVGGVVEGSFRTGRKNAGIGPRLPPRPKRAAAHRSQPKSIATDA